MFKKAKKLFSAALIISLGLFSVSTIAMAEVTSSSDINSTATLQSTAEGYNFDSASVGSDSKLSAALSYSGTDTNPTAKLFVCSYGEVGALDDFQVFDVEGTTIKNFDCTVDNSKTIKLFIWDGYETIKPLGNSYTVATTTPPTTPPSTPPSTPPDGIDWSFEDIADIAELSNNLTVLDGNVTMDTDPEEGGSHNMVLKLKADPVNPGKIGVHWDNGALDGIYTISVDYYTKGVLRDGSTTSFKSSNIADITFLNVKDTNTSQDFATVECTTLLTTSGSEKVRTYATRVGDAIDENADTAYFYGATAGQTYQCWYNIKATIDTREQTVDVTFTNGQGNSLSKTGIYTADAVPNYFEIVACNNTNTDAANDVWVDNIKVSTYTD